MSVDREDLDELEESMYDCWCITADIKKTLDVSDNIEDDVRALMKVYDIKFKVLANNVDEVDNNLKLYVIHFHKSSNVIKHKVI